MINYAVCISDLHLARWLNRCPQSKPNYMLEIQPMMLADRLGETLLTYNSKYLFLLGDLIDDPDSQPQIIVRLHKVIERVIELVPNVEIHYILGQHDMKVYQDNTVFNSYVHTLLGYKNVSYSHDRYLDIEGTSVYLSNYSRGELYYPKKHVNVWGSHISFGFVPVDCSYADLIVAGDIHAKYDVGNMHSVCSPFQFKPSEPEAGYIGLIKLNGSNSEFIRLNSDTDTVKFLRFKRDVKSNFSTENKTELTEKIAASDDFNYDGNDLYELIGKEADQHNLLHIHNSISKSSIPEKVNFNFNIKMLKIRNVRSIYNLDIDFEKLDGITQICAENGAGKSTLLYCLYVAFVGDKKLKYKKSRRSEVEPHIKLILEYNGNEFIIDRAPSGLSFVVNKDKIQLSKKSTQEELQKYLPFIPYLKYLFLKPKVSYFESINHTEFVKLLFNLKIIDYLKAQSIKLSDELTTTILNNRARIAANEKNIKYIESKILQLDEKIIGVEAPNEDIEYLLELKSNKEKLESNKLSLESAIEAQTQILPKEPEISDELKEKALDKDYLFELSDRKDKLTKAKSAKSEYDLLKDYKYKCDNCGYVINKDIEAKINAAKEASKLYNQEELSEVKNLIEKINSYNNYKSRIESISAIISDKKAKLSEINNKLIPIYSFLSGKDINKLIENKKIYNEYNSEYLKYKDDKKHLLTEISELKATNDALMIKKSDYNKYKDLLNFDNEKSIPSAIVKKLLPYLSTDLIKFSVKYVDGEFILSAKVKVGDDLIEYSEASTGQQALLDMFIIVRVTTFLKSVGICALDEPFSSLDESKLKVAVNLLNEVDANKLIIVSHQKLLGNYDNKVNLYLDEQGKTKLSM